MRAGILVVLGAVAIMVALASHMPARAAASSATHAVHRSPSPEPSIIYHASVSPLCAALVHHVAPVIAMITQNDQTIARSPSLFSRYNRDLSDVNSQGDPSSASERDMTLQHLAQLVGPLANNVNAINRELENTAVFPTNPKTDEEKMLDEMRDELLKTLAAQAVSLDLINGYVQTQQLAEMQHEGLQGSSISAITGADTTYNAGTPSPNPLLQDPNQAGLQQNPYTMDPASVPGITGSVGVTPLSRLISALRWLQQETTRRENIAATTIGGAVNICRARAATPSPHP